MKTELNVEKEDCNDGSCPMPLDYLAKMNQDVESIEYNEEEQRVVIESEMNQEKLVEQIEEMGYTVHG